MHVNLGEGDSGEDNICFYVSEFSFLLNKYMFYQGVDSKQDRK